jgi:multidrug efflux pump subunit AcrA (membrane-fusion protein)
MLSYLPSLATVLLAVLQLAKDWGAHQTTWRRALVLVAIVLLGVGGSVSTYYANGRSATQHLDDQKRIAGLENAVQTANANQEANTKQFVRSFKELSEKLSGLEVQVKTSGLQKEAARLRAELEATQKALSPPKAELEASLGDLTETLENLGIKEISVPQSVDGTVEFTIKIGNKSAVQAKNGSVFLRICEKCDFAEEPKRFTRPVSAPSYDREMIFQAINATTGLGIPLKVKPPPMTRRFEVDVIIRCENCVVRPKDSLFVNH